MVTGVLEKPLASVVTKYDNI